MENSKKEQDSEKDLESQEQQRNTANVMEANPEPKSVRAWKLPLREQDPIKTAEAIQAQTQAEDFWKKIYNSMKNVQSKEQAESLFKDLPAPTKTSSATTTHAAVESEQKIPQEEKKTPPQSAKEQALAADGFVDVVVDSTPTNFPYVADKVDEEYRSEFLVAQEKRRKKRYLCCSIERCWCTLMLVIPLLAVLLTLYFVLLTPNDPTTSMENVTITKFAVTDDEVPKIETSMEFTVKLRNPNRYVEVVYEKLNVRLTYRSNTVGSVSVAVAGYKQQEKNSTMIQTELPLSSLSIVDATDSDALKLEVSRSNVKLEFKGMSEGHFRTANVRLGKFDTPINCVVNVKPESADGKAEVLSASCYNRPT